MPVVFKASTAKKPKTLAAYMVRPSGIYFATQNKNEQILLLLRRHPITNLGWIIFGIILILTPFFIFPLFSYFAFFPFSFADSYKLVFSLFWYITTFAFILVKFLLWYFNVNIVTNKRVVDIDFYYLLAQEETATKTTQIEDVTYRRVGFLATLFNYGNVHIQTAGAEPNIEFLKVPQPARVVKTIVGLMGK